MYLPCGCMYEREKLLNVWSILHVWLFLHVSLSFSRVLFALRLLTSRSFGVFLSNLKKSHSIFNTTNKKIGFLLLEQHQEVQYDWWQCNLYFTSHSTVQYGAFQWRLSIVLWQKPQFVTFPVLYFWGQQLSNEYPFYLFPVSELFLFGPSFQSHFSLANSHYAAGEWLSHCGAEFKLWCPNIWAALKAG